MRVYVCMYVCMYVCVCACVCMCMYVCVMYVCMFEGVHKVKENLSQPLVEDPHIKQ